MKKRGFTLIELLIVVIIIGVLVTLAIGNYMRSVERSKAGKAMNNLLSIRNTQTWYRACNDQYCDDVNALGDWGLPLSSITADRDWTYTVPVHTAIELEVTATRAVGPYTGQSITIDENGKLTTTAPQAPWDVK